MQNCISFETLATLVFVLVDDWYQSVGEPIFKGRAGRKPKFSNSELMTLQILSDYYPFPGETQLLGYVRANHLDLFPNLIGQSQYNRRGRKLCPLLELFRQKVGIDLGISEVNRFILDTKPIPVVGYKRSKKRSDFLGSADYGVCASRDMKYFGYKLVMLSTMDGIPVSYELVPANTDERVAADELLTHVFNSHIFADKGFIGQFWQSEHHRLNGNEIWTPKRANQTIQNPKQVDKWLNSLRERIEGAFNEVQNTGRNLERLLRKKIDGLKAHVIAKMTSHTVKLFLRREYGIDVQTFTQTAS